MKFLMEMIGESTGIIQINTYNIFGKSAFKKKNCRWSQTIRDIDVFITVPKDIQRAKQLKVKIDSLCLTVEILQQHGSFLLVNQTFPHKVKPDECLWSLVGEHVQVCTFH